MRDNVDVEQSSILDKCMVEIASMQDWRTDIVAEMGRRSTAVCFWPRADIQAANKLLCEAVGGARLALLT